MEQETFRTASFLTARTDFLHYTQAAHAAIFAKNDDILWDGIRKHAAILMQIRFDGQLGFPGGLLDSTEEEPVDGLNRELQEEIGLDVDTLGMTQDDFLCCHISDKDSFVSHFYTKEVPLEQFVQIERGTMNAREWGRETLGLLRVPLYRLTKGTNKYRGFPLFLANQFAGTARWQLVKTIIERNLLPAEELKEAVALYAELANLNLSDVQQTIP